MLETKTSLHVTVQTRPVTESLALSSNAGAAAQKITEACGDQVHGLISRQGLEGKGQGNFVQRQHNRQVPLFLCGAPLSPSQHVQVGPTSELSVNLANTVHKLW